MCDRFGVLPNEGGLLDQDYWIVLHMNIVLDLQHERQKKEEQKRKAEEKAQSRKKR